MQKQMHGSFLLKFLTPTFKMNDYCEKAYILLQQLNHLVSATISPGEKLLVP